ncbi:unnamed protein product [[Actinomadura] parvosata subsp. kistnae]|nr:hypothetical protein [Nonomuraea sp. ATCC 55076]SPL96944.1 unnamed protein product [Actinomadura parvosata subsp. kistnae]
MSLEPELREAGVVATIEQPDAVTLASLLVWQSSLQRGVAAP